MAIIANLKKKFYFVAAGYFKFFANISLKKWHPRIIIITGSAGKTTMLNLIESQLGAKAHYSHDANSAFGIAFDVLGQKGITGSRAHWIGLILKAPWLGLFYKRKEKFYVVECDGERPHEAEFVAKWLKPEVSCWVSLGRSHAVFYEKEVKSGRFMNIDEAIAHEFATIPENTKKFVLIDGDNEVMIEKTANIKAKVENQGYAIIACSEGAINLEEAKLGKKEFKKARESMPQSVGFRVAKELEAETGIETRTSVLGYLQRGGQPKPYDIVLATTIGAAGADFLAEGEFGKLVAINGGKVTGVPLSTVAGVVKAIPEDDPVLQTARDMGICFGD